MTVLQSIHRRAAAVFAFAPIPVTVLTTLLYGIIFALVLYTDELFDVPRNMQGLDLDRAYADLHQITARPHPYLSHANDDVRAYLLSQLEPIAEEHAHVHLSDDLTSSASWVVNGHGVYFEGTNVLVKIDGTDSPLADPDEKANGVLFSVHYDSVSTAPGATDDGMGVVTLLELVRYLAVPEHRPRRTAIFFFNNGEEDGLNGAYVYWKHPWSNLTSSFINLEGAASGGRPLLFRSTSLAPTRAFASGAISHLQADVLTADAYKSGVVRSYTDYQVYAAGLKGEVEPMAGLDVAFYKNRALYHTPRDSIPGMGHGEGRKALWAMMEAARGAGLSLLNDDDTVDHNGEPGVYFDLFRSKLVLFSLRSLFVSNVVLLVIGPIITLILLVMLFVTSKKSQQERVAEQQVERDNQAKAKTIIRVILGWSRFWIALIVGVLAHIGLVVGFIKINPFVVHGHPYLVLLTFTSLSFLAIATPLQLLQHFMPSSPSSQKLVMFLEHYFLTWVLLIVATAEIQRHQIAGLYWVTVWNICAFVATAIALIEASVRGMEAGEYRGKAGLDLTIDSDYDESNGTGRRQVRGVLYEAPEPSEENGHDLEQSNEGQEEVETEATEITPLMHQHSRDGHGSVTDHKYGEHAWWISQLVISVPLFALLIFQLELLQLQALMNTLVDGSSPATVYSGLSILSMLIFIPMAPFAHKLHHRLTLAAAVVFVLSLTASWAAFPFTQQRPFKVFFQQQVRVDVLGSSDVGTALINNQEYDASVNTTVQDTNFPRQARAVTRLSGLRGYVDRYIVPEMPSSGASDVRCFEETVLKPGLFVCEWESDLLPSPGGDSDDDPDVEWLDVWTTRLNATSALIELEGTNTRGCRLYFNKPITYYIIHGTDQEDTEQLLPGYEMPAEGVKELRLWTRTWGESFSVEFGWEGKDGDEDEGGVAMEGRAACEWAEYASASAGGSNPVAQSGLIPALEEVKSFLPLWSLPSKVNDGLVEVWTPFKV